MKSLPVRILVLVVAAALLAVATNAVRSDGIPLVRPTIEEGLRKDGITPIHLDTAKLLLADPKVLFVDARPANVFRRGRIPGATSFPDMEFDDRIAAFRDSVPFDRPMVVYCDGIECNASGELSRRLRETGYKYIYLFFGGWVEWRESGERIEK